jgi:class 3 adenylate cyclase
MSSRCRSLATICEVCRTNRLSGKLQLRIIDPSRGLLATVIFQDARRRIRLPARLTSEPRTNLAFRYSGMMGRAQFSRAGQLRSKPLSAVSAQDAEGVRGWRGSDRVLRGAFCLLGVTQDQSVAGYGGESLVAGFSDVQCTRHARACLCR